MPLSAFQQSILRLLAQNRSPESYVASATVLHQIPDSPRFSDDLDMFHDVEDSVARSAEFDVAVLDANGFCGSQPISGQSRRRKDSPSD